MRLRSSPTTEPTLYFWHIPKTAGTSLTWWLDSQFEPDAVFPPFLLDGFTEPQWKSQLGQSSLLRGHFADAPLRQWPKPLTTITVLREPVARSLSHLAHIERDETNPLNERLAACRGQVRRVLADPVLRPLLENTQTRWLGLPWRADATPVLDLSTVEPELVETLRFQLTPEPVDQRTFIRALTRLGRIDHVGTTDRLDRFCRRVAHAHGWTRAEPPRANARPDDQSAFDPRALSSSDRDALREVTRYDSALYRMAQARCRAASQRHKLQQSPIAGRLFGRPRAV